MGAKPVMIASIFLIGCAGVSACAAAHGPRGVPSGNLLTREEWRATELHRTTSYELLEHLRPSFLLSRRGQGNPEVYVDGHHVGGIEYLHVLAASAVDTIEYVGPLQATVRYGDGYDAGVIVVRTVRGR